VRRRTLVPVAASVLLLGGCDPAMDPSTQGTVTDSAGVRIVEWPDASSFPVRTLGLDDGWMTGVELEFGHLVDLVPVEGGGVAALDAMNIRLVVLGPDGTVRATMGRAGEGPGEFSPQGLGRVVATDSSFLVPDLQLQRVTEFDLDGAVLATHPYGAGLPGGEPMFAVDWRRHPDGGLAFRVLEPEQDLILRMRPEGVDTLKALDMPPRAPNQLLEPTVVWDMGQDGRLVWGRSDRPRIETWRVGAFAPEWIGRRPGGSIPVTEEDERHLQELLLLSDEARGGGALSSRDRDRILASVQMPTHRPVLAGVLVDGDGRTWVRQAREITGMGLEAMRVGHAAGFGGPEWEVLAPDGTLVEVVRFPDPFSPLHFGEACVYGIVEDDLGVERPGRVCPQLRP
jgi:hypothetical protein